MLTQKRLHDVLHYDPKTGIFTWRRGKRKGKPAGVVHDARGFLKVQIDNERHFLHRLAWLWMTGMMSRWRIEHINGDHGDNRWANLRQGDRLQNGADRAPLPVPTGVQGIWQVNDRYEALIATDTVTRNLGSFATLEEAREALAQAAIAARKRQRKRLRPTA
ncbi:MAG: HNH endonuclease [Rhodobacteraceae bacterium HLUCCA12]|nr:MAG: HNH endonuclease [Rhodobacteraceae bacterium HLUCCA12]